MLGDRCKRSARRAGETDRPPSRRGTAAATVARARPSRRSLPDAPSTSALAPLEFAESVLQIRKLPVRVGKQVVVREPRSSG